MGSSPAPPLFKGHLLLAFQCLANRLHLSKVIRIVIGQHQCLSQNRVTIAVRDLCQ